MSKLFTFLVNSSSSFLVSSSVCPSSSSHPTLYSYRKDKQLSFPTGQSPFPHPTHAQIRQNPQIPPSLPPGGAFPSSSVISSHILPLLSPLLDIALRSFPFLFWGSNEGQMQAEWKIGDPLCPKEMADKNTRIRRMVNVPIPLPVCWHNGFLSYFIPCA